MTAVVIASEGSIPDRTTGARLSDESDRRRSEDLPPNVTVTGWSIRASSIAFSARRRRFVSARDAEKPER